jgi:hypothetical protein
VIVRELFARLGLQVDEAAFAAADAALGVVRKGLFGLAGVATAVAGGFAAAVGTMVAQGGRLDDLSKQVGVSTDALQTLGYAADQNGVSIDELAQSLQYIARQAYEASTGGKAQASASAPPPGNSRRGTTSCASCRAASRACPRAPSARAPRWTCSAAPAAGW